MSEKIYYGDETGRHEAKGKKLEEILQAQADAAAEQKLFEAEQLKKEASKESAMAKLKKLGLTDDEIESLLP